jgi:competence protein ComEC
VVEGGVWRVEEKYEGFAVTLNDVLVDGVAWRGRVLVRVPEFSAQATGVWVRLTCSLQRPEPFDGFAYDKFLASRHIYATCRVYGSLEDAGSDVVYPVRALLGEVHRVVRGRIDAALPEPHSTLLAGLWMGDDSFSDSWSDVFRQVGISHIVAASGSNIALVANLCSTALFTLGVVRQRAFIIILASMFGFVVLSGGESAVTRAAIMAALTLVARDLGRATSARNIYLLTVTAMVVESPLRLRYDPGFQLSALATLGLLLWSRPLSERLSFLPERFSIRESLATTLAATIATFPITVFSFGTFSPVSILANGVILPFLPLAMLLGAPALLHPLLAVPERLVLDLILSLAASLAL